MRRELQPARTLRSLAGLIPALLIAAPLMAAPLMAAPTASARQEEGAQEPPKVDPYAGHRLSSTQVEVEIERIRLMIDVDRKFQTALEQLDFLRPQIGDLAERSPTSPKVMNLMVRYLVEYGRVLVALGESEKAWQVLEELTSDENAELPYRPMLMDVARNPSIVKLKALIAKQRSGSTGDTTDSAPVLLNVQGDRVEEAVLAALRQGTNGEFLRQLGARAVPGLLRALRADPDKHPVGWNLDALYWLMVVEPETAASEVLRLLPETGIFFRLRTVSALETSKAIRRSLRPTAGPPGSMRTATPALLEVARELLLDPDLTRAILMLLPRVIDGSAQTPELEEALAQVLETPLGDSVLDLFDQKSVPPASVRFLERALDSADADLRTRAASALAKRRWNEKLASKTEDPDARVRAAVARALQVHQVSERTPYDEPGKYRVKREWYYQETDERWRRLVLRLLRDPEASVRLEAIEALDSLPTVELIEPGRSGEPLWQHEVSTPLDFALYTSLLRDPDPVIRLRMVPVAMQLPLQQKCEAATILAADSDPFVLEAFSQLLQGLPWVSEPARSMGVLRTRARNAAHPFEADKALGAFHNAKETNAGLNLLIEWALAQDGDRTLWSACHDRSGRLDMRLRYLRAELLARVIPRLASMKEIGDAEDRAKWIEKLTASAVDTGLANELLAVGRDPALPPHVRYMALTPRNAETPLEGQERVDAIAAALLEPVWADPKRRAKFLHSRLLTLRAEERNATILALLTNPGVDDFIARGAANQYALEAPLVDEVEDAIVKRWVDDDEQTVKALQRVLEHMEIDPGRVDVDTLSRAALNHRYDRMALGIIAQIKDTAFFPVLTRIIREKRNLQAWPTAIDAIASYISDDAAELLLEAAALAPYEEYREQCLKKLEGIREYQIAKERWAGRRVESQTREQVVADLLRLLEDENLEVRVQAIGGLATFEAVEALPRLIRLLKSPEPDIADAARAALKTLNRPADPGPRDSGGD